MALLMKEKDRRPPVSGGWVFTLVLAAVLVINFITVLINRLHPIAAGIASTVLILGVVGIAYIVIDRMITEYNYVLTGDRVIFEKVTGKREKPVLEVNYRDILSIKPGGDRHTAGKMYYFLCNRKSPGRYTMVARCRGKDFAVVFCPSPALVKAIQKRMG